MFTGIITGIGTIKKRTARGLEIAASDRILRGLKNGDSISVHGACLTVTAAGSRLIKTDVMPETWRRTMLGKLKTGKKVNLELPLRAGSLISGHFVQGHVDGVARVARIEKTEASYLLSLEVSREISRYLVEKGSIAVNGVSLTVVKAGKNNFSVGIIPHTWRNTALHEIKGGDPVNIEIDIMAKYIKKFLHSR